MFDQYSFSVSLESRRPSPPLRTSRWLMSGWSSQWPFSSVRSPCILPNKSCPQKAEPQRVRIWHLKLTSFFYQCTKPTLGCHIQTMMYHWKQNGWYSLVSPPYHACTWNSGVLLSNFAASCRKPFYHSFLFFLWPAIGRLVFTSTTRGQTWKSCACNEVKDTDIYLHVKEKPFWESGPCLHLESWNVLRLNIDISF